MKKKTQRLFASLLALGLLFSPVGFTVEEAGAEVSDTKFLTLTGEITEVIRMDVRGNQLISAVDAEGNAYTIVADESTFIMDGVSLEPGEQIEIFYDQYGIQLMIYPPRYTARVIAPVKEGQAVYVGRFDDAGLSMDDELIINIDDKLKPVLQDGTEWTEALTGHLLTVVYGFQTLSLPPQTTPEQVIVLFEKTAPAPAVPVSPPDEIKYEVDGKLIEAPAPYQTDAGVMMVPLRAIAEALGYNVIWEAESRSVMLGNAIGAYADKDYYVYARMAPINLGQAPSIQLVNGEGVMYVPLSFFREVAKLSNAYLLEDMIVINNFEKMQ